MPHMRHLEWYRKTGISKGKTEKTRFASEKWLQERSCPKVRNCGRTISNCPFEGWDPLLPTAPEGMKHQGHLSEPQLHFMQHQLRQPQWAEANSGFCPLPQASLTLWVAVILMVSSSESDMRKGSRSKEGCTGKGCPDSSAFPSIYQLSCTTPFPCPEANEGSASASFTRYHCRDPWHGDLALLKQARLLITSLITALDPTDDGEAQDRATYTTYCQNQAGETHSQC